MVVDLGSAMRVYMVESPEYVEGGIATKVYVVNADEMGGGLESTFTSVTTDELSATDGSISDLQTEELSVSTYLGFFGASLKAKTSVSDPSVIVTSGTAGGNYTSAEQTMINSLKTDVTNLQTKLAALFDALQAIGLV